jgi:hypothetical protein
MGIKYAFIISVLPLCTVINPKLWAKLILKKLELWVISLRDTPRLQYYDVQSLEYRYISKLIISPSKF